MKRLEGIVPEGVRSERAVKVLARLLPQVPGWRLRDAFADRDVKRNGQRITADTAVSAGDVLHVFLPEGPPPLEIVHEDAGYVIINKRQGMEVQGPGSVEAAYEAETGQRAYACHRLDVQTGGLLLLAKHEQALQRAEQAFAEHSLRKVYHALVVGHPAQREATLHAYLLKDADRSEVRVFDHPRPGALPIETRYRVLSTNADISLLEVELITGRTHQIRAHLAHIGHPVVGDDKYGDRAFNRAHGARRQKLWATGLTLWDGRSFSTKPPFEEAET